MTENRVQRRAAYWDRRIRDWAATSYARNRSDLMAKLRTSIDARRDEATRVLSTAFPQPARVIDLGCGAGQFLVQLARDGKLAPGSLGRDFSPAAINLAHQLHSEAGIDCDTLRFEQATVAEDLPPADVVTGLGLLDWLDEDQIDDLFRRLQGRRFVLSFSEQDNSPAEIVHRVYLVWRLRFVEKDVRAYHHRRGMILGLVDKYNLGPAKIVSSRAMRFGRLVHNLPG